jgi:putative DNA primase/helicase
MTTTTEQDPGQQETQNNFLADLVNVAQQDVTDPPPPPDELLEDEADQDARGASHYHIASRFLDAVVLRFSRRPVYCEGLMWFPDLTTSTWRSMNLDKLAIMVGRAMVGFSRCMKLGDYNAVAKIAAGMCEDERFFLNAAPGVVAGNGFHTIENGAILRRPVTLDDRIRHIVDYPIDPDHPAPIFKQYLKDTFTVHGEANDRRDALEAEQVELLQELVGLALLGQMAKHQVAVLLFGPPESGKSTILKIVKAMFQNHETIASNPTNWDREYYLADLAGKRLNVVGEFGDDKPVPIEFKAVLGGDLLTGRHPSHRPFTFICTAAHFFNANHYPPTKDRSDAFFRRWRILAFNNRTPAEKRITDLDELIVAKEMPYVLAWALEGARRTYTDNRLRTTFYHHKLLGTWQNTTNSVSQFFMDNEECVLESDVGKPVHYDGSKAYSAYQEWCVRNGQRALGRNSFYSTIEETGGRLGVRFAPRGDNSHGRRLLGVGPLSYFDK